MFCCKKVFPVLEAYSLPRSHSHGRRSSTSTFCQNIIRANTLADTPQEEFWIEINYEQTAIIIINQPKENTVRGEGSTLEREIMWR